MNFKPNIHRITPEKVRSAFWLVLASMLFLASSFAESSWSGIGPEPESAVWPVTGQQSLTLITTKNW